MCTAISFATRGRYFGRNLDLEGSPGEAVVLSPRAFPFAFRHTGRFERHPAILGMAHVADGVPLYYDAMNESGLAMAALSFPGLARYEKDAPGERNLASYELLPWVLCTCATLRQAEQALRGVTVTDAPFSRELPPTALHWMVSDGLQSLVVEAVEGGLRVHRNPVGVLTNAPNFAYHLFHLQDYGNLSPAHKPGFLPGLAERPYSRGLGGVGLPGDFSSASRFVRAAFVREMSLCAPDEHASVNQFFHILRAVEQPLGSVRLPGGGNECTLYSACCSLDAGVYYYTTYHNSRITGVALARENLNAAALRVFPLEREEQFHLQNA